MSSLDPKSHQAVGIAQAVFYVPVFGVAGYLGFKKHGAPRLAWIALMITSILRIVGGIVLHYSAGIGTVSSGKFIDATDASLVLQACGMVPLIVSTFGLFQIIQVTDIPTYKKLRIGSIAGEVILAIGFIGIIWSGAALRGKPSWSAEWFGANFVYFGYSFLLLALVIVLYFTVKMWKINRRILSPEKSEKALQAITCSVPFLFARILYAVLTVWATSWDPLVWSPLWGDARIFVGLHCVPEYIVAVIYLATGFRMPPVGKLPTKDVDKKSLEDMTAERPN